MFNVKLECINKLPFPAIKLISSILKKRMIEFFTLGEPEKNEVINNALEAGPTIPFPNFSKLFKTWLKILTTLTALLDIYIRLSTTINSDLIYFSFLIYPNCCTAVLGNLYL